jgi:hypothetical protein
MFPRAVYLNQHVTPVAPDRQIVKYMEFWKFKSLINQSALYFRRIDHFEDTSEGTLPLAVWNLNSPEIQNWYNGCKERIFVCCWNLDEAESPKMWSEYAKNSGVRIRSTIESLTTELSIPAPTGVGENERDGLTVGAVAYIDFDNVDVYSMLSEGPSSVVPAFRKRHGFTAEHEFRAILRPGSASGELAQAAGLDYVLVPMRPELFIHEIRYAPAADPSLANALSVMLAARDINIPVTPSSIPA